MNQSNSTHFIFIESKRISINSFMLYKKMDWREQFNFNCCTSLKERNFLPQEKREEPTKS